MDYVILEGNNRSTLEGVVCVAVVWNGRKKNYYQAMKRKI